WKMKPRRRHSETSFSMSMEGPRIRPFKSPRAAARGLGRGVMFCKRSRALLAPVTLGDAHRADFDAGRVAAQLGDDVEQVHLRGGPDVLIIAQLLQLGPPAADFQRPGQNAA